MAHGAANRRPAPTGNRANGDGTQAKTMTHQLFNEMNLYLQCLVALFSAISLVDGVEVAAEPVEHPNCRLFLAESTIPNAGLGVFTGVDLRAGQAVAEPDVVVPLEDLSWHVGGDLDFHFLWNHYSWVVSEVGMDYDLVEGHALVLGTGCMLNCDFALINAVEGKPDHDHAGLHRSRDPGVTGFTGFHNQRLTTTRDVPAGGEIFVNYDEPWFNDREEKLGPVPYARNFRIVDKFLKKFKKKSLKYQRSDNPDLTRDLWSVVQSLAGYQTRNSSALPPSFEEMQSAQTVGSAESRLPRSVRTLEWLAEHGRCMDNIRPGNSTVRQAGRGAFAARPIPEGGLVAPGPVLHVADRTALNLYGVNEKDDTRDAGAHVGMQLILNYCFGHGESTVLLCPYTSPSAYINHSGESPNAKIVWAKDSTPGHNALWLKEDVRFLKSRDTIGLSIDFVALREIQPGEEVFIDYGPEWEEAWDKYVREWVPPPGADDYVPASVLQNDFSTPLRTVDEQQSEPYPDNIVFYCHYDYVPGIEEGVRVWEDEWAVWPTCPCTILSREEADGVDADNGSMRVHYTVFMWDEEMLDAFALVRMKHVIPAGEVHVVTGVPRWAIRIQDEPYSKDEFMPYGFRHEMMMPDEMFPEGWKNLRGELPE